MRKILIAALVVSIAAALFTSCVETRGAICPSHDKNYFRKG